MNSRSPTDTLVRAMEDVEEAEHCLVVLVGKDIAWYSSTDSATIKIGILETAKISIVRDFLSREH